MMQPRYDVPPILTKHCLLPVQPVSKDNNYIFPVFAWNPDLCA